MSSTEQPHAVRWGEFPRAQSRSRPWTTRAARKQKDRECEDIKQTERRRKHVEDALATATDWDVRELSAIILDELAREVIASKAKAEHNRQRWKPFQRGGGAVTAAVASVSAAAGGGALTAQATGTTAVALGLVLLVLGGIGASATALGSQYERSRKKRRLYAQLWWDIWDFATFQLPTTPLGQLAACHEDFKRRWVPIGE